MCVTDCEGVPLPWHLLPLPLPVPSSQAPGAGTTCTVECLAQWGPDPVWRLWASGYNPQAEALWASGDWQLVAIVIKAVAPCPECLPSTWDSQLASQRPKAQPHLRRCYCSQHLQIVRWQSQDVPERERTDSASEQHRAGFAPVIHSWTLSRADELTAVPSTHRLGLFPSQA